MILVLGVCGFVRALLGNSATDVSCDRLVRSPDVAPLRGSTKRRKRQKLLIRIDHFISCTLGAAIPPGKWTLVSGPRLPWSGDSRLLRGL